ncbi:MAG: hypothetical protein OEY14_17740, partial [Myxococcales bacterium]|nr:hypothetical protein [Myxococcales bacterium]
EAWPETPGLFFATDADGLLDDLGQARQAALSRVLTTGSPLLSTLLRVPMPAPHGGRHAGGALFTDLEDPALLDLIEWIESEPEGSGGEDLELTDLELQFAEDVLPVLVERCGRAGCHGPHDIAFFSFSAQPEPLTGTFAPRQIRASRKAIRKLVDLWGADPAGSRLIRKAIGPIEGGLLHRGGESTFFPEADLGRPLEAPAIEAILEWIRAERAAAGVVEGQSPTGLIFVRGPVAERRPYRLEAEPEGSDLFLSGWPPSLSGAENLTAALHPEGPAEVRDPALSHDGARIAFAMRRAAETFASIWELQLETRAARRISPEGAVGHFVQPTYGPDGRIVAVWDGHLEAGTDAEGVPPELVALDPASGALERLTFTPTPEVRPAMLAGGKTRGELIFGTRRVGSLGDEAVLFRFPLCHDASKHGEPEYHVQFGASMAPHAPLLARDLPDGRQAMIVLEDPRATDDRGFFVLLDRSLGPTLPRGMSSLEASMGGYREPLAYLDPAPRFRDPAPLPDGRILIAADDPAAWGQDAIYLATLAADRSGARLDSLEPLLAEPGISLRSPTPIFVRPLEDDGHVPVTDPSLDRGIFVLRDVAVLESIYQRPAPYDPRPQRADIAAIRLVALEGISEAALGREADGGTAAGLGPEPPARILAEIPLPEDRSGLLSVPARLPIKLQWIDADGMVVGSQLDRWFFAEGGEVVPGGTNTGTYGHTCSGCHGSLSGDPADTPT